MARPHPLWEGENLFQLYPQRTRSITILDHRHDDSIGHKAMGPSGPQPYGPYQQNVNILPSNDFRRNNFVAPPNYHFIQIARFFLSKGC